MIMRFLRPGFLLLMLLGLSLEAHGAADVEFRWAILADSGSGLEGLDFSGGVPPVVHTGTPLQIYLEHLDNCYIYLFLLDSSNQLTPLYPPDKGYYNYGFPRGQRYIPPGMQTFAFVPPPGMETIYVVATSERQFQLERLTEEFLKHAGSLGQQQLLLQEVGTFVDSGESTSIAAEDSVEVERKVKLDGVIRTIGFQAVEVDSGEQYGRRLLIDHR